MAISELQFITWSHQGATTTAKTTHESIRRALHANTSPVRDKNLDISVNSPLKVPNNPTFRPSISGFKN